MATQFVDKPIHCWVSPLGHEIPIPNIGVDALRATELGNLLAVFVGDVQVCMVGRAAMAGGAKRLQVRCAVVGLDTIDVVDVQKALVLIEAHSAFLASVIGGFLRASRYLRPVGGVGTVLIPCKARWHVREVGTVRFEEPL